MKVALVHRYYPSPGGVTSVVNCLKKGFEKKEEVVLITNNPNCKEKGAVYIPGNSIGFYLRAYKYVKKNNFDVVHSHSFPMGYFSPFLKRGVILSVHGYDKIYDWPRGLLMKLFIIATTMGKGICYFFVKDIIAVSEIVKNNLVKRWRINPRKIEVIHNGVDFNEFYPEKVKRNLNQFRVFLNSTTKRKGYDRLVEWARNLIKDIPQIKFVIVGGNDQKLDRDIKNHFEFLGQVPFSKMRNVLNSVDLVLLPSINEPFGLTAIEGMACEKPVIVSEYSGVKDIIDGKNGIVSSFEDFPKNIKLLFEDKKLRKNMGVRARKTVIKELSPSSICDKHLEVYRRKV